MIRAVLLGCVGLATATIIDSDTSSVFRPTVLGLTPDPPVPDQPVYLSLIFDNPGVDVTDGTVTTLINVNGLPYSDSKPLCEDTACPIVTGSNNRSAVSTWPSVTGKILSTIKWTGVNGESLLCIQTSVKVLQQGHLVTFIDILKKFSQHHKHMAQEEVHLRGRIHDGESTEKTSE